MKEVQKKISEKEIYRNEHKKVLLRIFKTNDGSEKEIPVVSNVGSMYGTMVLALGLDNNIYYGKEYRDGPEIFIHNFPVGRHEQELSLEENALKELEEELGMRPTELIYLGETIVGGYDVGFIKYYLGKDCLKGEQKLDRGENFEIKSCSIEEFEQKIISGEINCPMTIACYTQAKLKKLI